MIFEVDYGIMGYIGGMIRRLLLILISMTISASLFALAVLLMSVGPDVKRFAAIVLTVERNAAMGYIFNMRTGYTHLYPLRLMLGFGITAYGLYYLWLKMVWGRRTIIKEHILSGSRSLVRVLIGLPGDNRRFVWKCMLSIMFTFLLLEVALRIRGADDTYTESIGHGYVSYFNQTTLNTYNTYRANDTFILDHRDFRYQYETNELGQREKPFYNFRDSPGFKIMALGDSYTEGVGTSYDSTWPRRLGDILDARVYNAGHSGNDPFFEYVLYRDKLKDCNTDLVIVAINVSDLSDYFFRGGMERFRQDGVVVYRRGPWYERLYQYSYIFRTVFTDICGWRPQMFVTEREYEDFLKKFVPDVLNVFLRLRQAVGHSKLLVVLHPGAAECIYRNEKEDVSAYNIMTSLMDQLKQHDIAAVDLYPSMCSVVNKNNWMEYTYKNDKHYNAKGYQLFADQLYSITESQYPGLLKKAGSNQNHLRSSEQ